MEITPPEDREWKKECHYTDERRDVLEITPPSDLEICLSIDFAPLGPRDCPLASPSGNLSGLRVHILHPSALEIALGLRPRAIPRASGCKINASANLSVLGGRNFHYTPPIVSVIIHYKSNRHLIYLLLLLFLVILFHISTMNNVILH